MPAHIHADLMKQYYEDALETNKPWERWQFKLSDSGKWIGASAELAFSPKIDYRRKPVALCQVEGRDVFPGDKLWHRMAERWISVSRVGVADRDVESPEYGPASIDCLSWTEPARTKTVYQWAVLRPNESKWFVSDWLFSTEQEVREQVVAKEFRRLDYTALEVPA